MNFKNLSIKQDHIELHQAIAKRNFLPVEGGVKSDEFLSSDLAAGIGKRVELQRNADGSDYIGTLESVKIDIEAFTNKELDSIDYRIKLEEYDEPFAIFADSIEQNSNNLKKYYFELKGKKTWRIEFK